MTLPELRFGTDGWRGVIARDATFRTFERLADASAATYLRGEFGPGDRATVLIGHDPRFHAEAFSRRVAERFARAGIAAVVTDRPIPTPAVSLHVRRRGYSGGIAVTASHNPAEYSGFKLKASYGGSAPPELYAAVEGRLDRTLAAAPKPASIKTEDLVSDYREALGKLVNLEAIRDAGLSVLSDAMHGAAFDGLASIVGPGRTSIESFRAVRDVNFGGGHPEPIARNLEPSSRRVVEGGFDLAVATDGDADRLGVLDSRGRFVSPHRILALLVLHAYRHRKVDGGIARSFSTSLLLERIARKLSVPILETAIGFKYIADLMISGQAAVGGEESGGYGFGFHLPERDGTLSALLLLEHLAATGKGLDDALDDLASEFGSFEYARRDVYLPVETIRAFIGGIERHPPNSIAGERVTAHRAFDGVKLSFGDRGWLLLRLSGTEPMIRLYCEHEDAHLCQEILARAGEKLRAFAGRETA